VLGQRSALSPPAICSVSGRGTARRHAVCMAGRGLLAVDAHLADGNGQAHTMTRTHLHLAEEAAA
jgi:hypothetical protein